MGTHSTQIVPHGSDVPKTLFRLVHATWVMDGMLDTEPFQHLKAKFKAYGGGVHSAFTSAHVDYIITRDWASVIMKWSWRWIHYLIRHEGLKVVHTDWIKCSLIANRVVDVTRFDLSMDWASTKATIQQKVVTDLHMVPRPHTSLDESASLRRVTVDDLKKSIFFDVKAVFLPLSLTLEQEDVIKRNFIEHRGKLCETFGRHTTHVITSKWNYASFRLGSRELRKSVKRGCKVVHHTWVLDSLVVGGMLWEGDDFGDRLLGAYNLDPGYDTD